jgi:hypothetical protein
MARSIQRIALTKLPVPPRRDGLSFWLDVGTFPRRGSTAIHAFAETLYYPVKSELKLVLDGVALFVKFPARLADLEYSVSGLRLGRSAAGALSSISVSGKRLV